MLNGIKKSKTEWEIKNPPKSKRRQPLRGGIRKNNVIAIISYFRRKSKWKLL